MEQIMDWKEYETEKLLRDEFRNRNFYLLGEAPEFSPLPVGFKNRENAVKFLRMLSAEYKYVAYKNITYKNITYITGYGEQNELVRACIFIKIGSCRCEPIPIVELSAFYHGRMYQYVAKCFSFFRFIMDTSNKNDIKGAIEYLFKDAEYAIQILHKSIITLIIENRWPEEQYTSNVNW